MLYTDTKEAMTSKDYKERFKAEYWQLKHRIFGLGSMLGDWDYGQLDFEPTCPKELLEDQLETMLSYQSILEERAIEEDIDLE